MFLFYLFFSTLAFGINSLDDTCTQEGVITNTVSVTYQCTKGKLVPIGCITQGGLGVRIGDTAPNGNIIKECQKTQSNSVALVPVRCSINGHEMKPDEEYSDKSYYYSCTSKKDTLVFEPKGCIGSSGDKVPIGGFVTKQNYKYKCNGNETSVYLEPAKCVVNNKEYSIGDVINDGTFWSMCEKGPGYVMSVTLKGCIDNSGNRVNPGDQFKGSSFVYRCEQDGKSMGRKAVACVETKPQGVTVVHYSGEKWLQPTASDSKSTVVTRYLIECTQTNDAVGQNPVRCYFEGNNFAGTYVDPGCMKKVGKRLLKCTTNSNSGLQGNFVDNATNKDQMKAQHDEGLQIC